MRRTACLGLILGTSLLVGAPAAADTLQVPDPADVVAGTTDTVDSTVDDVVGTVEDTAAQASGTGGSSGSSTGGSSGGSGSSTAGSAVGGVISSAVGTVAQVAGGGSSGGGSSASGGSGPSGRSTASAGRRSARGRAASPTRARTRFDRLPRRFETLLERIELGRHVRANLRRLERALASASPELRHRVLRLIRAEIARLRHGGVTPSERRRIARLQWVARNLTRGPAATATTGRPSAAGSPTARSAAAASAAVTTPRPGAQERGKPRESEVLGTQAGGGTEQPHLGPVPVPSLPDGTDRLPFWIGLALLALLVLGFVGVVVGVTNHVLGRARSS